MKPELVTWLDSATHEDGWSRIEDIAETVTRRGLLRIESVGFVVHETDDALTLAASWFADDEGAPCRVSQPLTIPKAMVVERRAANSHSDPEQ